MSKQEITLKFNFSFGELVAQVLEKQTYLERDAADLLPRGVTPARMADLANLLAAFQDVPEDGVMLELVSVAVANRTAVYTDMLTRLRDVAGVASLALGAQSAEYRTFQYGDINELSPAAFLLRAETMCDRADVYAAQLAAKGISAADITAIRDQIPVFQTLIKEADKAKGNRDTTTQTRRQAANDLYAEMAALAEIAKVYYQDRDEAKYNDYIIYSTSETAQTRTGRLSANEKKTRKWEALTAETEFIAENESAGDLKIYFSQTENGEPTTVFKTLPPFSKQTLNIATDLGYDKESNATHFILHNTSTSEVVYRIRVE